MNCPPGGSALGVKSALIHLFVLITMLFAGLAVPVAAHGHESVTVSADHSDSHAAFEMGHSDDDPQDDLQGGIAPHHHHCPAGIAALAPVVTHRAIECRLAPYMTPTARLNSRALEPLTEPPAA